MKNKIVRYFKTIREFELNEHNLKTLNLLWKK